MKHPRSNELISFDVNEINPIDKRRKAEFQLIVKYHTFWIYEKFFDTETRVNKFIEDNFEEFYRIGRGIECNIYAYQQELVKRAKENLGYRF